MSPKIKYALGTAAVILSIGTTVLAAATAAPTAAKPTTISAQAVPATAFPQEEGNVTFTATADAGPTGFGDKQVRVMRFDGNDGGMMATRPMMGQRLDVGYGGGFHGGHAAMMPFVCFALFITMLLVWTTLVLLILALHRHLFKKPDASGRNS